MSPLSASVERKLLGLLGLGVRSRGAVVGVQQVRDAAVRGKLKLAVVAPDVSKHSLDKVVPLLRARQVMIVDGPTAQVLGGAVGRETTAVVGVVNWQLARGIRALLEASAGGAGKAHVPRTP